MRLSSMLYIDEEIFESGAPGVQVPGTQAVTVIAELLVSYGVHLPMDNQSPGVFGTPKISATVVSMSQVPVV